MKKMNLSRLVKVFFIVFLPLLFIVLSQSDMVKAGDVSNNISSLTVSSEEITDGGQTTVKFTFDEHAQKIQPGDTLKVNWTSSGTVFGVGFKKTIPLSIDGTYVGDMVITDGSATVTFNEAIKNLQNIRGWGEFEIEGHNDTATDKEHVGKFTIISGARKVELNVKKMATGVNSAPFYLKAGDMHANDPEHILWTLTINAMNLDVDGDVRVEDDIQGGHSLVKDSFSITTTGNKPGYYGGSTAIDDFLAAFPGSTFTVDAAGKITVTIPQSEINKTGVLIFYQTKVENENQKNFLNNTKVWYHVKGEQAVVAKEVNAFVANINANGGVDGDMTSTTTTTTTQEPTTTTTTTQEPTTTTTTTQEPSTTTTTTQEPTTTTTTTQEPSTTTTTTQEPTTTTTTTQEPTTTTTTTQEPTTTTTTTQEPTTTTTTTQEPTTTTTTTQESTTTTTTTQESTTTTTTTQESTTTTTTTQESTTTTTTTQESTTTTTQESTTTTTTTQEPTTTTTTTDEPKTTVTTTDEPSTTSTTSGEPKTTVTTTDEPTTTSTTTPEEPENHNSSEEDTTTTTTTTVEPKTSSSTTENPNKPSHSGTTTTPSAPGSNGENNGGGRKTLLPNTGEVVASGLVFSGILVLAGAVGIKRKLTRQ
ncbi:LPXTG-motif cell wall anchor domain protein [Streptococcus parasanguinis F0405]|uniref:LPXTG-motif cell wall anchor domain protein n=2 Tax=Streptococcus parasanguinis TaxID=1318 RepID=E3CCY8_STRPA|nr:LPXTG cell wall anchor domain-containing protein [Streptococcus parasanguinis]EFQ55357.1 LPXTG-motif cell wall anchor domain protein [Streptococcus parasanguinis F0405]